MSLAEAKTEPRADIGAEMRAVGKAARGAARRLARATTAEKNKALGAMAAAIRAGEATILAENAVDLADAREAKIAGSFLDRLT
jgi:glutamate-5-semialdehyde dehydrogenase